MAGPLITETSNFVDNPTVLTDASPDSNAAPNVMLAVTNLKFPKNIARGGIGIHVTGLPFGLLADTSESGNSGAGVLGRNDSGPGVWGESSEQAGVYGSSQTGPGVAGNSQKGPGVKGGSVPE